MKKILEEEKKYLEYVKSSLALEIAKNEKALIDIPKTYTSKLQGDQFLVESLMSLTATKLRKLQMVQNTPYFGRIDFLSDKDNTITNVYIGKTTISNNNHQVVTDWRAPICSLYYDSNLGTVSYNAPSGIINGELKLKRQIIIKDGVFINAIDSDLVSEDDLLQPYLSENVNNKMKSIIFSIQREQNQIIRKPILQNIIVQGVAGSGKTSVALHRIAYLVYTLGEKIQSKQILALAPNKYFLDYISSVLPELDTEPVDQKTYLNLVNDLLNEKFVLTDENEIFKMGKGLVIEKKIQNFKSSLNCELALMNFLRDYFENGLVPQGICIDGEEIYSPELIKSILTSSSRTKINYELACDYFVKKFKGSIDEIYDKLNKKYRDVYVNCKRGDIRREEAVRKSTELYDLVKKSGVSIIKDYFKKINLKPLDIYKLFVRNIEKYTDQLTSEEILKLKESTLSTLNKHKVSFEDLPSILYIHFLLNGSNSQYKHIVIDEAQDYGLFHIDVLKKLFNGCTFSIYGDIAQSIYSYRGIRNWESLSSLIFKNDCEILELKKSYRNTTEITNNSNGILKCLNLEEADPVIRHGDEIQFSDNTNSDSYKIETILDWKKKGYNTIAIICKTEKEAKQLYKKLENSGISIQQITSKSEKYDGGVFILTSPLSKGLEFDAVIINDASNDTYDVNSLDDMHMLYVACTRALHELKILYKKDLCPVFENSIRNEKTINLQKKLKI